EGSPMHGDSGDEGEDEDNSFKSLLEKACKAAEEASRYAKTAAEFSHQAAEAAETARHGRDQGSHDSLTKSIAHSAIVLTLTVVKAVRVVGYATLDVAAQCRIAARKFPECQGCGDCSTEAMSLGLEALNAALACAEVTELTAADLQTRAPAGAAEADSDQRSQWGGASSTSERYVGAAVKASLAAASASNAAMSAAIVAVEGSRQCMQAMSSSSQRAAEANANPPSASEDTEKAADVDKEADADHTDEPEAAETPKRKPAPTAEEMKAASAKRLVAQRSNNHK
ncbi:unnamed protein product, partial [Polarella glacialis]